MIVFLDASALVKLYQREKGSTTMHALFENAGLQGSFATSSVVALEVFVRLAKQGREGGRKERRRARLAMTTYFHHRRESLHVFDVEPEVVRDAEVVAVQHRDSGAGTLDLLHATFALRLRERVLDRPLVFVVADRKLRHLADRVGLRTFDPEVDDPERVGA